MSDKKTLDDEIRRTENHVMSADEKEAQRQNLAANNLRARGRYRTCIRADCVPDPAPDCGECNQ